MIDFLLAIETWEVLGAGVFILAIVVPIATHYIKLFCQRLNRIFKNIDKIEKATVSIDSDENIRKIPRIIERDFEVLCNPQECPFHQKLEKVIHVRTDAILADKRDKQEELIDIIEKMETRINDSIEKQKEFSDALLGFIRTVMEKLLNGKTESKGR